MYKRFTSMNVHRSTVYNAENWEQSKNKGPDKIRNVIKDIVTN